MKSTLLKIIAGVLLLHIETTFAADMYRCGNRFQNTPCSNYNNKATQSAANATKSPSRSGDLSPVKIDVDCRRRGDAAKKIMWQREVGKTQAQQLENAQDSASQKLIMDVYNHRGTALEVKNVIEQECMQQKEKNELADKLLIEAKRLREEN